jgi:anti-anti-sigma regulatory factor/ABC-type phosphate/phosphonate transport system substrate-binding protein
MPAFTLHIQPESSADPHVRRYALAGIVDVDAIPVLAELYALPSGVRRVELDFGAVQRVNSMGLAQLLKLFEHWQDRDIAIQVDKANRMTAMLFKMTGLDRFLGGNAAPGSGPAAAPKRTYLRLRGIVDISVIPVLEPLYQVPEGSEAELDFAEVQRVNSMGLAQLLKLFEHWEARRVRIYASHVGRMTGMLFKMTGLERFLVQDAAPAPARVANGGLAMGGGARPEPPAKREPAVRAVPEPQKPATAEAPGRAWQVQLQSNLQLNAWYFLNTYLQRRLGLAARLEIADALLGEQGQPAQEADWIFARPFDAVRLVAREGYRPIARPSDQSDEVAILARAGDGRASLAEFAAAAPDTFVYLLGRYLLDAGGLESGAMEYRFPGHEIKAVQALLKGEADLLFMHAESYRRLSSMTRSMVKVLDESEAGFAFHLWCLAPHRQDLAGPLREALMGMNREAEGRRILAELGYSEWVEPAPEDIAMLERIYTRYAAGE